MKKNWKRVLICAAIVLGSVLLTLAMGTIQFFKTVDLKAQDTHFVVRGTIPTKDILLVELRCASQQWRSRGRGARALPRRLVHRSVVIHRRYALVRLQVLGLPLAEVVS